MSILATADPNGNTIPTTDRVDEREQLSNSGECGKAAEVQVSRERVTSLRGILFDIDPKHYRPSQFMSSVPSDIDEFVRDVVQHWLQRHDVLSHAEVRSSGTGVHVLLWLDKPVVITSDDDRERWIGIVKSVQAALPIDPDQPDITALTRPVGSINSKSHREVTVIREGKPVTEEQVLALFKDMTKKPFATVMKVLANTTKLEPCPICHKEGTRLDALDWVGKCYGSCGTVKLEQLYDLVYAPRELGRKGAISDDPNG